MKVKFIPDLFTTVFKSIVRRELNVHADVIRNRDNTRT